MMMMIGRYDDDDDAGKDDGSSIQLTIKNTFLTVPVKHLRTYSNRNKGG